MTVKELKEYCNKAIKDGHGDKTILVASDDEGNNYRKLYYSFTVFKPELILSSMDIFDIDKPEEAESIIILG